MENNDFGLADITLTEAQEAEIMAIFLCDDMLEEDGDDSDSE